MKNLFNSIQLKRPRNNLFDLTHDVKLSGNMGELIPILCQAAVPGDKFLLSGESLIRFSPLVAPVMHRMDVTMHYFFVPNRIIWENWEKYITNDNNGAPLPAHPFLTMGPDITGNIYRLADYLGIPPYGGTAETPRAISALPFAAYQAVYNEYYRDQNLIDPVDYKCKDGENDWDILGPLRKRAWMHDYFTSALPWAQKGESVDLPLGKVVLDQDAVGTKQKWRSATDYSTPNAGVVLGNPVGGATAGDVIIGDYPGGPYANAVLDPNGSMEVEPTTINDLRRAFKLQEWLEKQARGGTRYIESILSHFGIKSSDARLQRPEYITGSKAPVVISEVLNTTGTEDLPQGNMAGHGISVNSGKFGKYFCEEHGFIIGIMSIMPMTAYQDGINREFLKINDPTEYYWPSFANLGEQAIYNEELFAYQSDGSEPFGYIPRYAEYKYSPSRVAGDFRTTLDFWHLGRKFTTAPQLTNEFVECNPSSRIFAVTDPDVQKLYCHVLNKVKAVRPMPKFGTPSF